MIKKINNSSFAIAFFIMVGCILRLSLSSHMQVMNADATGYFETGVTLTKYLDGLSAFWSPAYPIFCILIDCAFNNIELSGKLASILTGTGLILVIFVLSKSLYGSLVASIAGMMIAFMPVMVYYSTFTTPEMFYLCFLYLSVTVFVMWIRKLSVWLSLLMGIFAAIAYLTRPEGFLLFAQITAMGTFVVFYNAVKNNTSVVRPTISLIVFVITFAIISLPYLLLVKKEVGSWSISPRSGYNLVLTKYNYETKLFSLTPDRRHVLLAHQHINNSLPSLIKTDAKMIITKYGDNFCRLVTSVLPNLFINKYILLFFIITAIFAFISKWRDTPKHLLLLFFAFPFFITPFFVIELRTQIYILPILVILSSVSLSSLMNKMFHEHPSILIRLSFFKAHTIWVILIGLALTGTIGYYFTIEPLVEKKGSYGIEQKKAGLWLRSSGLPQGAVMARKPWVAFYSGNENLPLPLASYGDILYYAKANMARYLVIDDLVTVKVRPALVFLLREIPKELELVYDNMGKIDRRVRVFRFKEVSSASQETMMILK